MFKNKIFIFITAFIVSLGNISFTAMAAEASSSKVNITFTPGDADIGIVDPDDPEIPIDGGGPGGGGAGSLVLNYVTTISFGTQKISAFDANYGALTKRVYVQLTDLRGTGEGWDLFARASTFKSGETETLKGAAIKLYDATCASTNNRITPPTVPKFITVPADGKTKVSIASADDNEGMGIWVIRWYTDPDAAENTSAVLYVPGGSAMLNENVAEITWYLTSTPA